MKVIGDLDKVAFGWITPVVTRVQESTRRGNFDITSFRHSSYEFGKERWGCS